LDLGGAERRRLLVSGLASLVLIGCVPALYGVSLPLYRRLFDLADGQGGQLLAAHGIGALGGVIAGMLGVRWLTARASIAALGLGSAVIATELAWPVILLGTLIVGVGFGQISSIFNRRFLAEFGDRGPGMVGLLNAVFGIGAIVAPLLFVWAGGAPRLVFAGLAVMAALLLPLAGAERKATGTAAMGLRALYTPRAAMLGLVAATVLIEVGFFGFGPSALIAGGMDELDAARLASVFFAGFMASRLSLFWLTRHFDAALLFIASVAGVALAGLLDRAGLPAVAYLFGGACLGSVFPTFFVWASGVLGQSPVIAAAILAAGLTGAALGPLVLGAILAATGVAGLFWVMGLLATGILILAVALRLQVGTLHRA
jgi:hypothetical protein